MILFMFRMFLKWALVLTLWISTSCGMQEFREQERSVSLLVNRGASKVEVEKVLGTNYLFYAKGGSSWYHLKNFLEKEGPNRMIAVREKSQHWPNIMLYSTPDVMTWVFLDENGKATDFYVCAQ